MQSVRELQKNNERGNTWSRSRGGVYRLHQENLSTAPHTPITLEFGWKAITGHPITYDKDIIRFSGRYIRVCNRCAWHFTTAEVAGHYCSAAKYSFERESTPEMDETTMSHDDNINILERLHTFVDSSSHRRNGINEFPRVLIKWQLQTLITSHQHTTPSPGDFEWWTIIHHERMENKSPHKRI